MIVIHCTATREDCPLSPAELTKMHRKRGFKCCGYHYFVRTDGEICTMRPVERAGAHAKGYNEHSIGIAYEGGLDAQGQPADTRTELQKSDFPAITQVVGHRDLSPDLDGDGTVEPEEWTKACPCFDVKKEL